MRPAAILTLATVLACPIESPSRQVPQSTSVEAAGLRAGDEKRLMEIGMITDLAEKRTALETYILENPNASNLPEARVQLVSVLVRLDPDRALRLADELLTASLNPHPRATLYSWKFAVYVQKEEEERVGELAQEVLDSVTEPMVLRTAARFDRKRAVKLLEKAVSELARNASLDRKALESNLRLELAQALWDEKQYERAVVEITRLIEGAGKEVAELRALPEKDPKRRGLLIQEGHLAYYYLERSQYLKSAGRPERALDDLVKAEPLLSASEDQRSQLEKQRARIYETMGEISKALEGYTRAYALRMDARLHKKIEEVALKAGAKPETIMTRARELRIAQAQPFKKFEPLRAVDGEVRSFDELRSKVTLVNFFFPT